MMATGLPIVATMVGGNSEALSNGECGILIPQESPTDIAEGVLKLVNDPSLRRSFGDNAAKKVVDNYSVSKMISNYLELYGDINVM